VGRIDDSERENLAKTREARDAIEALLAGKAPAVERTKTFGCSIKWSDKRDSVKQSLGKAKAREITLEPMGPGALKKLIAGKSDNLRVINVWATWCGSCVVEFPELVTIQRMYGHRAFELVTISADQPDQKEKVVAFLKKMEASSRNLHFEGSDKDKLFSAVDEKWTGNIPYTIVVRPSGEIVYRHSGQIDPLELRREIVKNLADDRG
jgi:thiol-disulfide isomerase/thioredoxin